MSQAWCHDTIFLVFSRVQFIGLSRAHSHFHRAIGLCVVSHIVHNFPFLCAVHRECRVMIDSMIESHAMCDTT